MSGYEGACAQLPPSVTWAPVAELPPFQEQLLRAANTPRDLRQGAFALSLTRSVCKSLSKASIFSACQQYLASSVVRLRAAPSALKYQQTK